MPVHPANNVEVLDEGVSQGFVRGIDFAGTGISAVVSGSRATVTVPTPSVPVGADPTAQIGLVTINGVATTFMRSDAAPPIDQGIAPTWTATHVFTKLGSSSTTSAIVINSNTPVLYIKDANAPADRKNGRIYIDGGSFNIDWQNDAENVTASLLSATWNTNGPTIVNWGNTSSNPATNFLGIGAATFGGRVFAGGADISQHYAPGLMLMGA